ncbi:MAG: hypothetical protein ABIY55_13700 [Kofleriaceae bacterium]
MNAKLVLPFGLRDPQGARARDVEVTPVTGHGELFGAEDPNPFRAVLQVLAISTSRLGALRGRQITPAVLGQLLPIDRDYMLLHVNRVTFGDERYQTVECPRADCHHRLDVQFALSSVDTPVVAERAGGTFTLGDGRQVRFRLPVAEDQAELHGLAPSALEAAFLQRCVPSDRRDDRQVGWPELRELPALIRADVVKHIVAASPELDLAVPLTCLACGRPFRFVFDPVMSLLAELKASRKDLMSQVHRLALSYHWSQAEILGLSRALRHEYLDLLQGEAGR